MNRLLYILDGVGFSLIITFFLKGVLREAHSLLILIFCIVASRSLWPKEGRRYLFSLLGFLLGIFVGILLTDLNFDWLFYLYFILAGFFHRLLCFYRMSKKGEPMP